MILIIDTEGRHVIWDQTMAMQKIINQVAWHSGAPAWVQDIKMINTVRAEQIHQNPNKKFFLEKAVCVGGA